MLEAATLPLLVAFIIDLVIGDPRGMPHPVRAIGRVIEWAESPLRRLPSERLSGIILTVSVVSATYFLTSWVLSTSSHYGLMLYFIVASITIYFTISVKSLADEARAVISALETGDIIKARQRLSRIVGRDTEDLDESQVVRACVESVAEGTVDGVISPIFYAALGGPAAAMAYKAVNTLDSMVGYRNDRYLRFGWASARLDDLANYVPARISLRLIAISSCICGKPFWDCICIATRDGRRHPSINSGIPEAAFAGALGVQLGGPSTYGGVVSDKPLIGEPKNALNIDRIKEAVNVAYVASFLALGLGLTLSAIVVIV
ncbi:MAG: adenosylcobinamide-phosphate synthase CbiB [Candidatus Brocadiales bacterium]|nr:adenosylcobinamide-phosphate synthase CbiB [Candidatus Bathyanammoxibius amoris]